MRMRHLGVEISEQRGCRDQVIGSLRDEDFRQIDADDCGQIGWCRDLSLEALGMRGIGRLQNFGALLPERGRGAEVHQKVNFALKEHDPSVSQIRGDRPK